MTSRTPPSRRDPGPDGLHALMRVAKATTQQTPGLGRVPAASPVVPQRIEAKLRGKPAGGGTTIPDGTTAGDAYIWDGTAWVAGRICTVDTTAPSSPYNGQFFYDLDATC